MDLLALPVAALVAALPALAAYLTGRRLLARADDPALPELLQARRMTLTRIAAAAFALLAFFGGRHLAWAGPALLLALLAGGYPLRRSLWRETWSFPAYVWAHVCAVAAFLGVHLLIALTPAVIVAVATMHRTWSIGAGMAMAALILLWQHFYTRLWLRLSRATPLERADLRERLAGIAARSRVTAPAVYRFGHAGSSLMNAVALPGVRTPAVAFSHVLLERLPPDEIAAVFAHEVAHLEHFDAVRLRRARLAALVMALLAVAVPLAVLDRAPGLAGVVAWLWVTLIFIGLALRAARSQAHETESDRRAVELTGDAEALVRALTALHQHARVPRRWSAEFERSATHPSLARRVQAIRAAVADAPGEETIPALAAPLVLRGATPGEWLALDAERGHWGAGAPAELPDELELLRARSTSYRAVAFGDLTELRVTAEGARRVLRAADRSGFSWSTTLRPGDVAVVQEALDTVDTRFGARVHAPRARLTSRLVAALLLLAALVATQFAAPALAAALALAWPVPAALAAAGALGAGRGALALLAPDAVALPPALQLAAAAMIVIGAAALWQGWQRRHEASERHARLVPLTLVLLALVQLMLRVPGALVMPDEILGAVAALAMTVAAGGAALAVHARHRVRVAGAALAVIVVLLGIGAAGAMRLTSADDRLVWDTTRATAIAQTALDARASGLRLSPGGAAFAVARWAELEDEEDFEERAPGEFTVGPFDGERRTVRARDVAFVSDDRLLALGREDEALTLREEPLRGDTTHAAPRRLRRLARPSLAADPTGAWAVTGRDPSTGDLVRISGHLEDTSVVERRWPAAAAGWFAPMLFDGGRSVVVARNVPVTPQATPFLLGLGRSPLRFELWRLDSLGGERLLTRLPGYPSCVQARADADAYCLVREGVRASLWRVHDGGAHPVGRVAGVLAGGSVGARHWVATRYDTRELALVDAAALRGLRVALPDSGQPREVVEGPAGVVVLSDEWDGTRSTTKLTLYRVADIVPSAEAPRTPSGSRPAVPRG